MVRSVTEPHVANASRLESEDSNQVCIINGEIDADGDGLGDDTEDRDACYTASHTLLADDYPGIGNTTLSSGATISTENTGTISVLAPHQLILKAADSVVILTGMIFRVAAGAEFSISSEPDVCP